MRVLCSRENLYLIKTTTTKQDTPRTSSLRLAEQDGRASLTISSNDIHTLEFINCLSPAW